MYQNNKKLINLIITGAATFCIFISLILTGVNHYDAWGWIPVVCLFLGTCIVLTLAIIDFVCPSVYNSIPIKRTTYQLFPLGLIMINSFFSIINNLINMGKYEYSRSFYFTHAILEIVFIAVAILVIYSFIKIDKKYILFCISVTYILYESVNGLISDIFGFFIKIFTSESISYTFRSLGINISTIIIIGLIVLTALEKKKEA